jgi:hypothetical protein
VYLIYAIKEKTLKDYLKASGVLLVTGLLAVAPQSGLLIATADYTKDTMRGGAVLKSNVEGEKTSSGLAIDYAYMWSYGRGETMTLLIPNFYGSGSHTNIGKDSETYRLLKPTGQADQFCKYAPTYWGVDEGKTMTSGPVYVGAIICFLFVFGLIVLKGREKWWLLIATIASIILAWGRHFPLVNDFVFYYFPLYNKFRTPEMALVIAEVTMATMAILAIKAFVETDDRRGLLKPLYIAGGITGGLCLIFGLFGSGLMSFSSIFDEQYKNYPELLNALVEDRKSMLTSDAWRSFFLIALAAGALLYYVRKPFKATFLFVILGALIFIDLWTVDKRFINHDSFIPKKRAQEIVATEADKLILQDTDPDYRVLNLTRNVFNESETSHFHKSIGGYSPAKLRRYQDIIDYHFSGSINPNVLNMLNCRYVITGKSENPQVQRNVGALGNAWFVEELKWVDSPDEEIVALKDFDPSRTAFIDKSWQSKLTGWESLQGSTDSTATISLTDYANPGYLIYESSSSSPHLAVFSEVFYKTWHAYIDGTEVPLVRVNYILRGLQVPAGQHKIEFRCIDDVYLQGAMLSKYSSIAVGIIIVLLLGYAGWREFNKKELKVWKQTTKTKK